MTNLKKKIPLTPTFDSSLFLILPSKIFWLYFSLQIVFPGGSVVKSPPASAGDPATRVQFLGWKDLLEEGTATHSSILAWRIPWTEEPGRLQSTVSQRVGHDWSNLAWGQARHNHYIKALKHPDASQKAVGVGMRNEHFFFPWMNWCNNNLILRL